MAAASRGQSWHFGIMRQCAPCSCYTLGSQCSLAGCCGSGDSQSYAPQRSTRSGTFNRAKTPLPCPPVQARHHGCVALPTRKLDARPPLAACQPEERHDKACEQLHDGRQQVECCRTRQRLRGQDPYCHGRRQHNGYCRIQRARRLAVASARGGAKLQGHTPPPGCKRRQQECAHCCSLRPYGMPADWRQHRGRDKGGVGRQACGG